MHFKRMCIEFCGCNVLKISIKSNCSIVPFRIFFALLIFYLEDLSTDVSRVLKVSYYYCIPVGFSLYIC